MFVDVPTLDDGQRLTSGRRGSRLQAGVSLPVERLVSGRDDPWSMPLSIAEREEFLAQPHVAALSVSAGSDRGPLIVPIWYHYVPGGPLWVSTRRESRKGKLIAETGRFSLLVDRVAPTTRYVSVEGRVTAMRPSSEDDLRAIASRYLVPGKVEAYVEFARGEYRIELEPEHWFSSDLGEP